MTGKEADINRVERGREGRRKRRILRIRQLSGWRKGREPGRGWSQTEPAISSPDLWKQGNVIIRNFKMRKRFRLREDSGEGLIQVNKEYLFHFGYF